MKNQCDFICKYIDDDGECEAGGGVCITDMCPEYRRCDCCDKAGECGE